MKDKVSVVLTAHNEVRYTALAISSLKEQYPEVPVIVVDHASVDETETYVRRLMKLNRGVDYVRWDGPRNLAHCWNLGVDRCKTEVCVVSNNDVVFAVGSLEPLVESALHSQIGVAIPQDNNVSLKGDIVPQNVRSLADKFRKSAKGFDPMSPDAASEFIGAMNAWWQGHAQSLGKTVMISDAYYPAGGYCFAVSKEKWRQLRGFNSMSYDYYGEDWDFFKRAQRWFKLVRCQNSLVWHFDKSTSSVQMNDGEVFDCLMKSRFQLIEDHEGMRELVSVVIPVKDRPNELKAALQSVVDQNMREWRCYVVNDGSVYREAVADVCNSFNDPRIGLWDLPENRGPSAARNYGIDRARGKYIALLDSDDMWSPNHLSVHVGRHDTGFWDMTYSDPRFVWRWWEERLGRFISNEDKMPSIDYWGDFNKELLKRKNYILTSSTVWWAEALKKLRFDETMRFEEDWDLCKRIGGDVSHVKAKTVVYCQQPENPGLMHANLPGFFKSPERPSIEPLVAATLLFKSPFTVVIPTKNRPDDLRRAISSVGPSCQVIVIDDESSDIGAVRGVCSSFRNVSLYANVGRGQSAARNLGVALCDSPWVKFLDDDDIMCNGWLMVHERVYKEWDLFTVDCVYPSFNQLVIGGAESVTTSQLAAKTSVIESLGGFAESLNWKEEQDLINRALASSMRYTHVAGTCVVKTRVSAPILDKRVLASGDCV